MSVLLCKTSDINDPGSMGFEIEHNGQTVSIFVIHKDGQFHAYINRCPHTGVNLDWQEHQFLDLDSAFIQCSTHDALFDVTSGKCIFGPCIGDTLSPVELIKNDDSLCAVLPETPTT